MNGTSLRETILPAIFCTLERTAGVVPHVASCTRRRALVHLAPMSRGLSARQPHESLETDMSPKTPLHR